MNNSDDSQSGRSSTIRFPVLQSLEIKGYHLFPGPPPEMDGLKATFLPGLTLVLGANGLGKTTLVWILYRLLTGPHDISGMDKGGDLGSRRLEPSRLRGKRRRLFAERVHDDAENARARVTFSLGERSISLVRQLSNLELLEFTIDGEEQAAYEKESFQEEIMNLAGVSSFGDWILLLRYLVFYFEDRRELVWDGSAQRQILRILFLSDQRAQAWTEAERKVLSLDSRARNLNATLTSEEKALAEQESLMKGKMEVKEELKSLTDLQEIDKEKQAELQEVWLDLDSDRKTARLELLKAEERREEVFRSVEHAKLVALKQRFPSATETSHYILAQLLADSECLVCGNAVPQVADMLEDRILQSECVICGSDMSPSDRGATSRVDLSDERLTRAFDDLEGAEDSLEKTREEFARAVEEYADTQRELHELDARISKRSEKIDRLLRKIPEEDAVLHDRRKELARLRERVATLKDELAIARDDFSTFMQKVKGSIVRHAPSIKESFEDYARDFLIEDCSLVWSPRKEQVGQTGAAVEFPSFELEMASASFKSPVRRSGPDQVSESQREFIDLSFRMALMAAADPINGGTLVIDAPESSLDAVFVSRAAEVLGRFADSEQQNRLVITSNLTDGELVPRLLEKAQVDSDENRMIDLFEVAEPTAAIRELRDEYDSVRRRVFDEHVEPES